MADKNGITNSVPSYICDPNKVSDGVVPPYLPQRIKRKVGKGKVGLTMKILIDTDWFEVIKDLPVKKQQEVLTAILTYPDGDSDTYIWKKVIFPALEKGRIGYFNKISKLKQYRTVSNTDTDTDTVVDTDTRTTRREEYIYNNSNSRNNNNNLSTTRVNPTLDEILDYARQQNDLAGIGGFKCSPDTAHDFYDYYSGIGWCLPNDAKTPILDWKPFLRKWSRKPQFKTHEPETVNIDDPEHFVI